MRGIPALIAAAVLVLYFTLLAGKQHFIAELIMAINVIRRGHSAIITTPDMLYPFIGVGSNNPPFVENKDRTQPKFIAVLVDVIPYSAV